MTPPHPGAEGGGVIVRPLARTDWPSVATIYGEGIDTGDATFETVVPSWEAWHEARLPGCRIVAEEEGVVVGFAAVSPVSRRTVYAGVAEVMVYVAARTRGRGVGGILLNALVAEAEAAGLWTLQASIFPENQASIRLHAGAGFRVVGTRTRVGRSGDGRWRDVVLLERRSDVVGVEPSPRA